MPSVVRKRRPRWTSSGAKVLFSLAVLAFLMSRIGWQSIVHQLDGLDPVILLAPLFLFFVRDALRAKNWAIVLAALGKPLAYARVLVSQLTGSFAGSIFPSGWSIDLARSIAMKRQNPVGMETALASTIALNISSVVALCIIASISAGVLTTSPSGRPMAGTVLTASGILLTIAAIGLVRPRWVDRLYARFRRAIGEREGRLANRLTIFLDDLDMYARQPRLFAIVVAIAMGGHTLLALIGYSAALAIGTEVSFVYFLLLYPIIVLARVLPISVASFGGEQAIFVYLFAFAGLAPAQAFTVSLVVSSLRVVYVMLLGLGHALAGATKMVGWRTAQPYGQTGRKIAG